MPKTEQDLDRLASRLLRETIEGGMYRDNDGVEAWHTYREQPLLALLRESAYPGMGSAGGGGSRTAGSPATISVEAVDLFIAIDREALDTMWLDERIRAQLRGRLDAQLEDRVRIWVEQWRPDPAKRQQLWRTLSKWVTQIESLLDPAKVVKLRGSACPACSNTVAMVEECGELVRTPALAVAVGSTGVLATCRACGMQWPAESINDLAAVVNPEGFAVAGIRP
ncbi:hypothetical protein [Zhihengliuella sp.]|uniref:DUF7340 domain-containing protein n=1 Tax=Zhihengliuella sp. TaxID=1954483 RepID=UPI0028111D1D|nr:hypothetical protein [Zhihengliuella sp.]